MILNQQKNNNKLIKIGSQYGGWVIPNDLLNEKSIVYLCGAGEDISFDVEIAENYKSKTFIIDPTPRAKKHFESLIENINNNKSFLINNKKDDFYKIKKENLKYLNFIEKGVWDNKEKMKFYVPKNKQHVSHSLVNLQKTEEYILVEVDKLSNIMKENNHNYIDLLKIDIEGAEYKVLNNIIEEDLKINVICVEFDEFFNPIDYNYKIRITECIEKLKNYGYEIIHIDYNQNYTFKLK